MFFPGKKKIPSKKITNSQHVLVVSNLQSLIPPLTSALSSGTRFSLHSSSSPFSALQLFRFLLRFFLLITVSIFFSFPFSDSLNNHPTLGLQLFVIHRCYLRLAFSIIHSNNFIYVCNNEIRFTNSFRSWFLIIYIFIWFPCFRHTVSSFLKWFWFRSDIF